MNKNLIYRFICLWNHFSLYHVRTKLFYYFSCGPPCMPVELHFYARNEGRGPYSTLFSF